MDRENQTNTTVVREQSPGETVKKERTITIPFPKKEKTEKNFEKRPPLREGFRFLLHPALLQESVPEMFWPVGLGTVALFFGLLSLTVGRDWVLSGVIEGGRLWSFFFVGLLSGSVLALLFAAGALGISLLCRKERINPFRMLVPLAGTCVFPLLLLTVGLCLQAFGGIAVSMAFGVMAVLWWLYLLIEFLRESFGDRFFANLTFVTVYGLIIISVLTAIFRLR